MKNASLSPRAIVLVVAVAAGLFGLSFVLSAFSPEGVSGDRPWGAHSYSSSYIGHAGFYETLRLMQRPVKRVTRGSQLVAGESGTIMALEPDAAIFSDSEDLLEAPRLLVALPKRVALPYPYHRGWVLSVTLLPEAEVFKVLEEIDDEAEIIRRPWPETWAVNDFPLEPSGGGEVQLIRSDFLTPLVGTEEGMLLGELELDYQKIMVLADPDVLSNHGLSLERNAAFMVMVTDRLRLWENSDRTAPLVIDEAVHGLELADGSPMKMLFRFPYVVVLILAAAAGLMMILAGAGRFGAPVSPKAELDFGKANLIANSVRLLDFAGHQSEILKNYIWMTVRQVARDLHAPRGRGDQAVLAWLDQVGQTRKVSRPCSNIVREADGKSKSRRDIEQLYICARDIHQWKGEMLNGPHAPRSHR